MSTDNKRFSFGKNWLNYEKDINEDRIQIAKNSITELLKTNDLENLDVIDIGCGSGLFSLAFKLQGANIYSFDYDPDSVKCTQLVKSKYFDDDDSWVVEQGSVLDLDYMNKLPNFDLVYSWGVLHHTGEMWKAIENASNKVKPGGQLFIGIYKYLGVKSSMWTAIKKFYNINFIARWLTIAVFVPYYLLRGFVEDIVRFKNPRKRYMDYKNERGMSKYYDWIDWIGGYPYEDATKEELVDFVENLGFKLFNSKDVEMIELVFDKLKED